MSDQRLAGVLADLAVEGDQLERLLVALDDAGWRTPTPAAGWDVATSVAHLAWTDEVAVLAATDKAAWDEVVLRALEDPTALVEDRKSTRLNSSHANISYAVFCL